MFVISNSECFKQIVCILTGCHVDNIPAGCLCDFTYKIASQYVTDIIFDASDVSCFVEDFWFVVLKPGNNRACLSCPEFVPNLWKYRIKCAIGEPFLDVTLRAGIATEDTRPCRSPILIDHIGTVALSGYTDR